MTCPKCGANIESQKCEKCGFDVIENASNYDIKDGVLIRAVKPVKDAFIPAQVTKIGESAFMMRKLESVFIPEGVTEIEDSAFCGCKSLSRVCLPGSLKIIGDRAFSSDPSQAALMVSSFLQGLAETGVYGCIKHFPGHGDTVNDTHLGYAQSLKTWEEMLSCEKSLRRVVSAAVMSGIPVPALSSALAYFDGLRCGRLPANLLQAMRDYFGAHTYERVDAPRGEHFHTDWTNAGGATASTFYNA